MAFIGEMPVMLLVLNNARRVLFFRLHSSCCFLLVVLISIRGGHIYACCFWSLYHMLLACPILMVSRGVGVFDG